MACCVIDVGGAGACHGPGRTTWRHSSGMTGFCGSTLTVTVNGRLAGLVAGSSSLWYTKAPAPVASTSDIARDNHLTAFSVASREASACVIANVTANTLTLSSTMASHGRWFSEMMAATPPESAATPAAARSLFMDRQEACFPGSGAAPGDDRPPAGATGPAAGGGPAEPGEGPAGGPANTNNTARGPRGAGGGGGAPRAGGGPGGVPGQTPRRGRGGKGTQGPGRRLAMPWPV